MRMLRGRGGHRIGQVEDEQTVGLLEQSLQMREGGGVVARITAAASLYAAADYTTGLGAASVRRLAGCSRSPKTRCVPRW